MFAANDPAKGGSFYLQSKIYRSKEVLDNEFAEQAKEKTSQPNAGTAASSDDDQKSNKK